MNACRLDGFLHSDRTHGLLGFLRPHAIKRQNIRQSHNTFEVMHVGAAYDRQEVQLASAHAVQGHVERVVWMDMRKIARVDNLTQPLATKTIVVATLQVLQVTDTNHPTFIADGPCTEFTGLRFLQGLQNGRLRAQYFRGVAHGMNDLALPSLLPRFRPRQVDAILMRQDLVDGLLLESRGNEKTPRLEIISGTITA